MHGRVTHTATTGGAVPTHAMRASLATVRVRKDGDQSVQVSGSIVGLTLADFGTALDLAVAGKTSRVYVELAGVTHWSLLAQAMVLTTARDLARNGRRLVLQSPSAALLDDDDALHVFERVRTESEPLP